MRTKNNKFKNNNEKRSNNKKLVKNKKKSVKMNPNNEKFEKESFELESLKDKLHEIDALEINNFDKLPISKLTLKGLVDHEFISPTKVQRQTLVYSLRGLDVVATARTGSGKTLAFIIPMLELLYSKKWSKEFGLGALIITPTRELSYQIYAVLNKIGKYHEFSAGLVIGGKDLRHEWSRVGGCNILICTPGRILQHMSENPDFNSANLQLLVLDEADQCLSLGFSDTMNCILQDLPKERQTLLLSATQTRDVKDLSRAGCKNPIFVSSHEYSKAVTPKSLEEKYIVCDHHQKLSFLWSFLKKHKNNRILVFLATCKQNVTEDGRCFSPVKVGLNLEQIATEGFLALTCLVGPSDEHIKSLQLLDTRKVTFVYDLFCHMKPGLTVMALHGGMHQLRRMNVYDEFCDYRSKKSAVLLATDVAARGLDMPLVNWVVQLDCPEDTTTYIHRVGRTARYAQSGEAILILSPQQEEPMISNLEKRGIKAEKKTKENYLRMIDIQAKVNFVLSKYTGVKGESERAFKSFLKHFAHMKDKIVFDCTKIDLDALARSFGLISTPRVRFLEKILKNRKVKVDKGGNNTDKKKGVIDKMEENVVYKSNTENFDTGLTAKIETSDSKQKTKTFNLGITTEDLNKSDSDDDFLKKSNSKPKFEKSDQEFLRDLLSASVGGKLVTSEDIAKKVEKKNLKLNKRMVFDEDGNIIENVDGVHSSLGDTFRGNLEPASVSGVNIPNLKEKMKIRDTVDKNIDKQRLKDKHKKEKEKLKLAKLEKEFKKDKGKDRKSYSDSYNDNYSDDSDLESDDNYRDDSDLESETQEIINSLPDPDKIYNKKDNSSDTDSSIKNSDNSNNSDSSDNEDFRNNNSDNFNKVNDTLENNSDNSDHQNNTSENSNSDNSDNEVDSENENNNKSYEKNFKGKRKARQIYRDVKRAKKMAANEFESISFTEKENLALFLLKSKK